MKKCLFRAVFMLLMLFCLTACTKDDLDSIDIKVDGSMRTSFSTGSKGMAAHSQTRTALSF